MVRIQKKGEESIQTEDGSFEKDFKHHQPRRPGALKGKIKISDDFDVLPDDISGPFGMVDK